MKVGTDGVLLGAWSCREHIESASRATREQLENFLDVGTGSGLIALMLAQHFPKAHIDAIDIDEGAVQQARENGVHASLSRLQDWQSEPYNLIVSNPPYFQNSLKNPDEGRKTARHTDTLSYKELIDHSVRLLANDGQLAIILPADAEGEVRQLAAAAGLYPAHITRVFSKENKPARRVLMAFSHSPLAISPIEDSLILEDEKGGRSAAYSELCKEFYL